MHKRQWRFYETTSGRRPVREFLDDLSEGDRASVLQEMRDVAADPANAKHLRGDIYEVRADGDKQTFRILFAAEGRFGHVLLAVSVGLCRLLFMNSHV